MKPPAASPEVMDRSAEHDLVDSGECVPDQERDALAVGSGPTEGARDLDTGEL